MSGNRPFLALPLLLLGAMGCKSKELDAPLPFSIEPNSGLVNQETAIRIYGRNFEPFVRANFDDKKLASVVTDFSVLLGDTSLLEVKYLRSTELQAKVPAGLGLGRYDLTVIDPRGLRGILPEAYVVREAPAADTGPQRPEEPRDAAPDAIPDAAPDAAPPDHPVLDLLRKDSLSDVSSPDGPSEPQVSTVAGTGVEGFNDGQGDVAQFANPIGIAVLGDVLYVGDYDNNRIRKIDLSSGKVETVAGAGQQGFLDGDATTALFNKPTAVAVDAAGVIYVADSANDRIRKITPGGVVTTLAGSGQKGMLDGPVSSAQFKLPQGIEVDGDTIYVADSGNNRIRRIDLVALTVSTLAGIPDPMVDNKGMFDGPIAQARFNNPRGLAVNGDTIYVADSGNNRIRLVDLVALTVSTFAGIPDPGSSSKGSLDSNRLLSTFWNPADVAIRGDKLYISDQSNHRIRVVEGNGVTKLSGWTNSFKDGPASIALFNFPQCLAVSPSGDLYISDQSNHRIRKISF